jgi:hypothetical protein
MRPFSGLFLMFVACGAIAADPVLAGRTSSFGNSLNLRPAPDEPLEVRIAREREAWQRQRQADALRRKLDRLAAEIRSSVLVAEIQQARRDLLDAQQQLARRYRDQLLLASLNPEHRDLTLQIESLERELQAVSVDRRRPDRVKLTGWAIPLTELRAKLRAIEKRYLDDDPGIDLARDTLRASAEKLRDLLRERDEAVLLDQAWQDARRQLAAHQSTIR